MKTRDEVSAAKLRGGFYSPEPLVDVCLDRVLDLLNGRGNVTLLEPSAGDGGFIRGLARHAVGPLIDEVTAIEVVPEEAQQTRSALASSGLRGNVVTGSALDALSGDALHDVAVGNPPFVRFQFVSDIDRMDADRLGRRIGVPFAGVSNLWIPVLLAALTTLRDGGVFSFIVPAECFTGKSAGAVRTWLTQHATKLRVDLFPSKSFPQVLQEVVVLSGQISRDSAHGAKVQVHDHGLNDSWRHVLDEDSSTWTGLLLRPEHLSALAEATASAGVYSFSQVARLSVATVTGANGYFCVNERTRTEYDLEAWTRPLLDRVRHAPGLTYGVRDHESNLSAGHPVWMIDSSLSATASAGARKYIELGEAADLHHRYKTRIRSPWWQVPVVGAGSLMLSKRSNHFPRLVQNVAEVVTTDTIYQGSPLPTFHHRERDIVGSFHNSLTMLTAEMFGRSFGGGVLELVPSETARLLLPVVDLTQPQFEQLDSLARTAADPEKLIEMTDRIVTRHLGTDQDVWRLLREARLLLRDRRFERN